MRKYSLIISLLFTLLSFSQSVFILGRLRYGDDFKVERLMKLVDSSVKVKKMYFYFNSATEVFYTYTKNVEETIALNTALSQQIGVEKQISSPSYDDIEEFKSKIASKYNSEVELKIVTINGNEDINSFNQNVYAKVDSLRKLKTKAKNMVFLIVFRSMKPRINIKTPKDGDSLKVPKLIIRGSTSEPGGEVYVKINDEKVFKQRAKIQQTETKFADWEIEIELEDKNSTNDIQAVSMNKYGEISEIYNVRGIIYKKYIPPPVKVEPIPLPLKYYSPITIGGVVEKCTFSEGGYFIFRFGILDSSIRIDKLYIIIEKDSGEVVLQQSIGKFKIDDDKSLSPRKITDSQTDYCLFIRWKDLGFKNPCQPDDSIDYNYYFKYEDEKYLQSKKFLKIHFPNFDGEQEDGCDCY